MGLIEDKIVTGLQCLSVNDTISFVAAVEMFATIVLVR